MAFDYGLLETKIRELEDEPKLIIDPHMNLRKNIFEIAYDVCEMEGVVPSTDVDRLCSIMDYYIDILNVKIHKEKTPLKYVMNDVNHAKIVKRLYLLRK